MQSILVRLLALAAVLLAPATVYAQYYCPDNAWQQQSPDPAFGVLNDVYGVSPTSVYAVGNWGTVLHFDGVEWTPMDTPTERHLNAVWGSADNNVYAVGNKGTLLHFNGSQWQALTVNDPDQFDLRDVHGGGGQVWIAGAGGKIFRGTSLWRELYCGAMVTDECNTVSAVWVSPQGNPCLVGGRQVYGGYEAHEGLVIGLSGGSPPGPLYDVWGSAENDIYALGAPGHVYYQPTAPYQVYHSTGAGFVAMAEQPPVRLRRISGAAAGDVFGIDTERNLVLFDGAAWNTPVPSPVDGSGLWGSAGNDVYIAGSGFIAHYDGSDFDVTGGNSAVGTVPLNDVWAASASQAWAVGSPGLYSYDGTGWGPVAGVDDTLNGIWGSAPDDVTAVGEGGVVWRFDGMQWNRTTLDAYQLTDIHGLAADDVYAVGRRNHAAAFHFDGAAWTRIDQRFGSEARAVFAAPEGNAYVGIDGGIVMRYDGSSWIGYDNVLGSATIDVIWGPSESSLYVGGTIYTIALLDGTNGTVNQTWPYRARDIWGTSAGDVWMASYDQMRTGDRIFRLGTGGWIADARTTIEVNRLFGVDPCDVFAVGTAGRIIHLGPITDLTVTAETSEQTLRRFPGQNVGAAFSVSPARASMEVQIDVTGATNLSVTRTTDIAGRVELSYLPDRVGTDTIVPAPVTSAATRIDTTTVHVLPPRLTLTNDNDTLAAYPGDELCLIAGVSGNRGGIPISFSATGANTASGSVVTDSNGRADVCYPLSTLGADTIRVSSSFDYPLETTVVSATSVVTTVLPGVAIDPRRHSGVATVTIVPGDHVKVYAVTDPPVVGATIAFQVSGAGPMWGQATTDVFGKAVWQFTPEAVGADTVTAWIADSLGTGEARFLFEPPPLTIEADWTANDNDTLTIPPGFEACDYALLAKPLPGHRVDMAVTGANQASGWRTFTVEGPSGALCYPVAALGTDTVTATTNLDYGQQVATISARAVRTWMHPGLEVFVSVDDEDSLLTTPGSSRTVVAALDLEEPVAGIPVTFAVRGANQVNGSAESNALGLTFFSYTLDSLGADTLTVTAQFDYGTASYDAVVERALFSYAPLLALDESHAGIDTMITPPDGELCLTFRVSPPAAGIAVDYEIRGANAASGTMTTGGDGRGTVCYSAPAAGVDTVTARTTIPVDGTPVDVEAEVVITVIQGADIPLVVSIGEEFAEPFVLGIVVSTNKELDEPAVDLTLTRPDGELVRMQEALTPGDDGRYIASIILDQMGTLEMIAAVTDLYGNDKIVKDECDVVIARSGITLDHTVNDGAFRVVAPVTAVQQEGALLIHRPFTDDDPPAEGRLVPAGPLFSLSGTAGFADDAVFHARYRRADVADYDDRRVGIYHWTGNDWEYAGGSGNDGWVGTNVLTAGTYGVFYDSEREIVPLQTALFQNYPNPFNPQTTIKFDLNAAGRVDLVIYDIKGRRVRTLVGEYRDPGIYFEDWAGRNDAGERVATGVYFCRLHAGSRTFTRKMILVK